MKNTNSSNSVTLRGFLGGNPLTFTTEKDQQVVGFSLVTYACCFDSKSGTFKDRETVWHNNLVSFNPNVVELVTQLSKGDGLELQGTLSYKSVQVADDYKYDVASILITHAEIWINASEKLAYVLANRSMTSDPDVS